MAVDAVMASATSCGVTVGWSGSRYSVLFLVVRSQVKRLSVSRSDGNWGRTASSSMA